MQDSVFNDRPQNLSVKGEAFEVSAERALIQLLISQKIALLARRFTARAARLFKAVGYTNAQRAPLRVLKTAPEGMTQAELAAGLQVSEPTLSRRVSRLLADGLISKQRRPGDGRANTIKLEPRGYQALEQSEALAAQDRDLLFRGLSQEELEIALKVLNLLATRIAAPLEEAADEDDASAS